MKLGGFRGDFLMFFFSTNPYQTPKKKNKKLRCASVDAKFFAKELCANQGSATLAQQSLWLRSPRRMAGSIQVVNHQKWSPETLGESD